MVSTHYGTSVCGGTHVAVYSGGRYYFHLREVPQEIWADNYVRTPPELAWTQMNTDWKKRK